MKNSQLTIEKKLYVKFEEGFSVLIWVSFTWYNGDLNAIFLLIPPEIYLK